MTDWIVWFTLAGILVIIEMFTGTFYLLMIAIGLAAGGTTALTGVGGNAQLVVAALIGISATTALRRSKLGKDAKSNTARDPNVNLDIGQTLVIDSWNGKMTARVMYRGAMWDVELEQGGDAQPGLFVIREVRGNRLIVANNNAK
jgi:membrane protein implicated in regulation of membrane protease activity